MKVLFIFLCGAGLGGDGGGSGRVELGFGLRSFSRSFQWMLREIDDAERISNGV